MTKDGKMNPHVRHFYMVYGRFLDRIPTNTLSGWQAWFDAYNRKK